MSDRAAKDIDNNITINDLLKYNLMTLCANDIHHLWSHIVVSTIINIFVAMGYYDHSKTKLLHYWNVFFLFWNVKYTKLYKIQIIDVSFVYFIKILKLGRSIFSRLGPLHDANFLFYNPTLFNKIITYNKTRMNE